MSHLASINMEDCSSPEHCSAAVKCLEVYQEQHPEIGDARFQEMKDLACQLKSESGMKQWQFAWSRCQETKLGFEVKLEAALRTKQSLWKPVLEGESNMPSREGTIQGPFPDSTSSASHFQERPIYPSGWTGKKVMGSYALTGAGEQATLPAAPIPSREVPEVPKLPSCAHNEKQTLESIVEVLEAAPSCPSTPAPWQLFPKRTLRKAQSFDLPSSCQRTLSEPARYGNTGVFIKGLEVSSTELMTRQHLAPTSWGAGCMQEERGSSILALEAKSLGRYGGGQVV